MIIIIQPEIRARISVAGDISDVSTAGSRGRRGAKEKEGKKKRKKKSIPDEKSRARPEVGA